MKTPVISEQELQVINDYITKLEKELEEKNELINAMGEELGKIDSKYYNAMKQIDRRQFGRSYERSEYDKLEFNNNRDVKVKHKSNGIIFELPISHVDINEKIDVAKKQIEENLEHYIKTMKNFYSQYESVEVNNLSVVNLERGELTVGYEENEKGKQEPIKEDAWIATFFYKLANNTSKTTETELIRIKQTRQELLFDVFISYEGFNFYEAWKFAESQERAFADKYMINSEFDYNNFYLKSIAYNQRQEKWVATYECSAFKEKE